MNAMIQKLLESINCPLSLMLGEVRLKRNELSVRRTRCNVDGLILTVKNDNTGEVCLVKVTASDADAILEDFLKNKPELKDIKDPNKYYVYFWQYADDFAREILSEQILDVMVLRIKLPIVEQLSYQQAFA